MSKIGNIYKEDGIEFKLVKIYERKDEYLAKNLKDKFKHQGYNSRIRHFYDKDGKRKNLGVLKSLEFRKGYKQQSINSFILSHFKQGDTYYFYEDVIEKLIKEGGYDTQQIDNWRFDIETHQISNQVFKTKDIVIQTKGSVLGATGFFRRGNHSKLSFYDPKANYPLIKSIKKNEKKKTTKKPLKYRYYAYNRPLMIGTHPTDNLLDLKNFDRKMKLGSFPNLTVFGYVEYSKKLTFQQIYQYELVPTNKKEYGKYYLWERNDKNINEANKLEKMYREMGVNELFKWKDRDPNAYYTLLIMGEL